MSDVVLEANDLVVRFRKRSFGKTQQIHAVNGVSLRLERGRTLALVGESGSGKSTTARAILKLVEPTSGSVRLLGTELMGLQRRPLRRIRRHAQMVFQDPYSSLDPSMVIDEIIAEPLRVHTKMARAERRARVQEVLELSGLNRRFLGRRPHEFSGGQRQRIAIARALATNPEVVIADEAVSALDVSTRNQILNLLKDLQDELGLSYLFISHDLGVVEHIAHEVAVMYLGKIVEYGETAKVFAEPAHPYTRALISAAPATSLSLPKERQRLGGEPPDPSSPPQGCVFSGRCPKVMEICKVQAPQPQVLPSGVEVSCHLYPHDARPTAQEQTVAQ